MLRTRNRALACLGATAAACAVGLAGSAALAEPAAPPPPDFQPIGTYATGLSGGTSAETSAFEGGRLYVTNSTGNSLDVVDASDPRSPTRISRIDLSPYGAGPNSVDVHRGLVAVAVESSPKTAPGKIVFLDRDGAFIASATVGALPDMLTFSRDGRSVIVANEGEPSSYGAPDSVDPEGTISIVSTRGLSASRTPAVRTVGFADFNSGAPRHGELPAGLRLNGPGASVAQDLEPEYVALSHDGDRAFVTLQEANGVAEIDLARARVARIRALGSIDHSLAGNGLDASDRDGGINIVSRPIRGLHMPDAIASFTVRGRQFLITANEGDGRDHPGFGDEVRAGSSSVVLDPVAFPDAVALKANASLGRLNVSRTDGLNAATGRYEALYSFGTRSATIWDARGRRIWDSGDQMERRVAADVPLAFNASNDNNNLDDRSDNKGPEPEGVAVGRIRGATYAFVGLERIGGFMVFDVSRPSAPALTQWANNRDYSRTPAGPDSGPEVLHVVDDDESPTGSHLVVVSNEVSGTVTFYEDVR